MLSNTTLRWALTIIVFFLTFLYFKLSLVKSISISCFICLLLGGWKFLKVVILTAPRDLRGLIIMKKVKYYLLWMNYKNYLLIDIFQNIVKKYPSKIAFYCDTQTLTFEQLDDLSNRIANILQSNGIVKGDVIALFMESRPAYVAIWLAMAKIGAIPALINFNLRHASLLHCIKDGQCKSLIYGIELTQAVNDILPELTSYHQEIYGVNNGKVNNHSPLPSSPSPPNHHQSTVVSVNKKKHTNFLFYSVDFNAPSNVQSKQLNATDSISLDNLVASSGSGVSVPPTFYTRVSSRGPVNTRDALFYIYTSGTTGLPKAAIVNHARFYTMACGIHLLFNVQPNDIVYDPLPLYHSAGGIVGVGQALLFGCSIVICRKFSASRFWDDVVRYDCTIVQYIGEICRYLLAQPHRPEERKHRVRLAVGNGIRPQIWEEFQRRFKIQQIGEFYGATESNANIVNCENKVGACGFTTRIAPCLHPVALLKVDETTGEPLRDSRGLCIRCHVNETGEMIGRIEDADPTRQFDGYVNKQATDRKVVYNVFKNGDRAFRSGDLLEMDELGYFYFRDRLGDTFRWRGENVSTTEIEGLIGQCLNGKHDCVVYGVEVARCEGRAGMACIGDPLKNVDVNKLARDIANTLPPYARPLFVRLAPNIEATGTFKLKKVDLVNQGYNPELTTDRLFVLDASQTIYKPIDKSLYDDIVEGRMRL